jgi:arylsulfatase A-like enzyme
MCHFLPLSTDLYPTFLDATGVRAPSTARLDGTSLLPVLINKAGERLLWTMSNVIGAAKCVCYMM